MHAIAEIFRFLFLHLQFENSADGCHEQFAAIFDKTTRKIRSKGLHLQKKSRRSFIVTTMTLLFD